MSDDEQPSSTSIPIIDDAKRRLEEEVERLRQKYRRARRAAKVRLAIFAAGIAIVLYLVFRR